MMKTLPNNDVFEFNLITEESWSHNVALQPQLPFSGSDFISTVS